MIFGTVGKITDPNMKTLVVTQLEDDIYTRLVCPYCSKTYATWSFELPDIVEMGCPICGEMIKIEYKPTEPERKMVTIIGPVGTPAFMPYDDWLLLVEDARKGNPERWK